MKPSIPCPNCREAFEELQEELLQLKAILAPNPAEFPDIKLTNTEHRFMSILNRKKGQVIHKEIILSAMYFNDRVKPDLKLLDVLTWKIREKLRGKGLYLKTHWGTGISLEEGEDPIDHAYKPWTKEEDEILTASKSSKEAAKLLGRGLPGILHRALKIGHRWGRSKMGRPRGSHNQHR